ncbi:BTAD domain-containing putative transcriptional regulator [Micromonospora sp. DT4]|uniref:BTAD domain-containing putative transcriptional regulator n=1 Tax=Micromonospora sp. DT4 TaxID=3393438 RepID=UPI003CEA6AC8
MLWRAFKALSAAIVIAALLAGIPAALALLGHNPLPALAAFADNPMARDDGTLFLAVFTCVGWLAWLSFAVAVITEVPALFGRNTRTLPGLSAQQWLARTLLSAVATAIIAPSITSATAATVTDHDANARPAAIVHTVSTTATVTAQNDVTAHQAAADTSGGVVHVVQRGEVLLDLAERYFKDRAAVKGIAEANYGTPQPDGRVLERGQTRIYAGWKLRIPAYNGITPTATTLAAPAPQATATHQERPKIVLAAAVTTAPAGTYEVCRGDTLWDIADSQLGDPEAWQQIWELNRGKTFDDGRTFTRPGLIRRGWVLTLPDAAADHTVKPTPETPTPPPDSFLKKHAHDGDEQTVPPAQPPAVLPGDDGVSTVTSTPSAAPSNDAPAASPTAEVHDGGGFSLPSGSWISLGLAATLAGAARLVWLHRRRRYTPNPPSARPRTSDPDLVRTPAVIRQVRTHLAQNATYDDTPPPAQVIAAAPVPLSPPPVATAPAAIGLAAGRGLLIAALADDREDTDSRSHVMTTTGTLASLIPGASEDDIAAQPRLTVTASSDAAIDWCEQQLLLRVRILAEHDQTDAAALRDADPLAEPMPPITLLTADEDATIRATALAAQGGPVNLRWIPVSLTAVPSLGNDGSTAGLLKTDEALDLLRTLTESQTGQPQPITAPADDEPAHDEQKTHGAAAEPDGVHEEPSTETGSPGGSLAAQPAAPQPGRTSDTGTEAEPRLPVQVSVLGPLKIHNPVGQPKPKRNPPWELMAYLIAVDGRASNNAILEDLLPDVAHSKAPAQLHTMVTGLRNLLIAAAGGGDGDDFLAHPPGVYILKPDMLDVDLWRMRSALKTAATAPSPTVKAEALRRALAEVKGQFADGALYDWMEPIALGITREVLDARVALASTLAGLGKPQEALDVLQDAINEEPLAEDLYRQAMDLHALLGDADAIRRLRRILTHILEQKGLEPTDDLARHCDNLLAGLRRRRSAQAQKAAAAYADSKERNLVR